MRKPCTDRWNAGKTTEPVHTYLVLEPVLVPINTVDLYEAMCRWSRGCRFEDLHDYFVHLASDMERLRAELCSLLSDSSRPSTLLLQTY